jgi:hypothetical protein
LFDAFRVEIMFLVAWKRYDIISLGEIDHAYRALFLSLVCSRVEFRIVELLNEFRGSWHPVWLLCSPHCEEDDWDQNA